VTTSENKNRQMFFSAHKRAVLMGKHHGWQPEFNLHPLAARISNSWWLITGDDGHRIDCDVDGFYAIHVLLQTATKINSYCDQHKIAGDDAAEYWLESFLWFADAVFSINVYQGKSIN
jgi:hypothetical protein